MMFLIKLYDIRRAENIALYDLLTLHDLKTYYHTLLNTPLPLNVKPLERGDYKFIVHFNS